MKILEREIRLTLCEDENADRLIDSCEQCDLYDICSQTEYMNGLVGRCKSNQFWKIVHEQKSDIPNGNTDAYTWDGSDFVSI